MVTSNRTACLCGPEDSQDCPLHEPARDRCTRCDEYDCRCAELNGNTSAERMCQECGTYFPKDWDYDSQYHMAKLIAERDRYKAALVKIGDYCGCKDDCFCSANMAQMAHEALNG